MIREIIRPSENIVHIPIPSEYVNRNIEVLIFDIDEPIKNKKSTSEMLKEFREISKDIPKFESDIDIIKIDEDMNSDIF